MSFDLSRRRVLVLVLLVGVVSVSGLPGPAGAATGAESTLESLFDRWLLAIEPRMLPEERELFDSLESDTERELFIRQFWAERNGDELLPFRWWRHFLEAGERYDDLGEIRVRTLLAAGKPRTITVFGGCSDVIRPIEIWAYDPPVAAVDGHFFVFYQQGGQPRRWSPSLRAAELMYGDSDAWSVTDVVDFGQRRGCWRARYGPAVDLGAALEQAADFDALVAALHSRVDPDWPRRWRERSVPRELPAGPLGLEPIGRYASKTIVRGRVEVPVAEIERNAEGHLFDRLVLRGDIWYGDLGDARPSTRRRGHRLIDGFEVAHYVAGFLPSQETVELAFYRRLRPGTYTLDLRLEDGAGRGLLRQRRVFDVPEMESEAQAPAGYAKGFAGLTRSEVGVLTTFPSIELLSPGDDWMVGEVDFEAVTTGGPIEAVELWLDDELAARDDEPPHVMTLDLGPEPRPRRVEARAIDPGGRVLARDAREVNLGSTRFAVHLLEPARGTFGRRAKVALEIPPHEQLDRLELYLGEERFATLEEPPFVHELPEQRPSVRGVTYVRVVAVLASGATAEDVELIDTRQPVDQVDVRLVELYTTVLDGSGRPVQGLGAGDFRVLEDGAEQPLVRFDTVENLSINVALLMDVSSSMRRRVEMAARSARHFFETVLTPGDRAALLTFSHDIQRLVPFTEDAEPLLAETAGLYAWGTTRLRDSLVYTLHAFGGLDGRRALVLLSDGQDVDSDFGIKQVLEEARRSRVAVYPIVLGVEDAQTLSELEGLAEESGGSFFVVSSIEQLDRVYQRIEEELRSQYLLVYEAAPRETNKTLRTVRVELGREGLRARTLKGYYP